jgi:hypothetical protein
MAFAFSEISTLSLPKGRDPYRLEGVMSKNGILVLFQQPDDSRGYMDPSLRSGFQKKARKQCYTSPFPHMLKTALLPILLLVTFYLQSGAAAQQNAPAPMAVAASELAQQVLSRSGSPSAIAVTFQNLSSIPAETQDAIQNAVFSAFRNAGVRLVKPETAVAEVQIVFSEDWQGYLWIAVIREGSASQRVMKRLPRLERPAVTRAPALTVRKITVWQQDTPVLDFFEDHQNLVVLEPDQLALYINDNGQWRGRYTLFINHAQPWPRDLRGRLKVNNGQITVFLPGTLCTGAISPPSLECRPSDDPWQLDQGQLVAFYSPRRNFFTGILSGSSGGASVVAFFSGATWPAGDQRQWVFVGTDGRVRLYQNDLSTPAALFNGWGSNLAAVHSNCGSGWQLLTTTATDTTRPDSIQALEISGRESQAASAPIDLAGAVLALWPSGKNSETANAVTYSPSSGKYEALVLTVTCN